MIKEIILWKDSVSSNSTFPPYPYPDDAVSLWIVGKHTGIVMVSGTIERKERKKSRLASSVSGLLLQFQLW